MKEQHFHLIWELVDLMKEEHSRLSWELVDLMKEQPGWTKMMVGLTKKFWRTRKGW